MASDNHDSVITLVLPRDFTDGLVVCCACIAGQIRLSSLVPVASQQEPSRNIEERRSRHVITSLRHPTVGYSFRPLLVFATALGSSCVPFCASVMFFAWRLCVQFLGPV
jgi:hypothetical protein